MKHLLLLSLLFCHIMSSTSYAYQLTGAVVGSGVSVYLHPDVISSTYMFDTKIPTYEQNKIREFLKDFEGVRHIEFCGNNTILITFDAKRRHAVISRMTSYLKYMFQHSIIYTAH